MSMVSTDCLAHSPIWRAHFGTRPVLLVESEQVYTDQPVPFCVQKWKNPQLRGSNCPTHLRSCEPRRSWTGVFAKSKAP